MAGAVATTVIAAIAKAADVPLAVASSSSDAPEVIPTSGVTTLVLGIGVVGVIMALAFNRWAKRPARTFVAVTAVLTVVSFITPTSVFAHNATTATRLVLELMHVVAAAIIIPPIAYRLARR
jgi:predicted MFS family arabinose efflux permease